MARILIIEDNPANMQLMAYLLNAFKHTVIEAASGALGLRMAQSERPDLILCDLQMPEMDGYQVAQRIKQNPHIETIPLVAVTAYAMVGDRDKVLASGFNGYIAKPIDPELFVAQVEAFLPHFQV
jgi:CheY-like chemotaxis protein